MRPNQFLHQLIMQIFRQRSRVNVVGLHPEHVRHRELALQTTRYANFSLGS